MRERCGVQACGGRQSRCSVSGKNPHVPGGAAAVVCWCNVCCQAAQAMPVISNTVCPAFVSAQLYDPENFNSNRSRSRDLIKVNHPFGSARSAIERLTAQIHSSLFPFQQMTAQHHFYWPAFPRIQQKSATAPIGNSHCLDGERIV